ncbi:MAG: sigma-70 family RNA polymerase sigma factor [Ruminococcus sp.]|nr:sigma-70 family RNA polymerase sigma factor [Ruminococcus sp.]
MDDNKLIGLFLKRDERAIAETLEKYGAYCRYIAANILPSPEDAEECTADALTALWNSIPPEKPLSLKAYLGRITRNLALNRLNALNCEKRGGGTVCEIREELAECVSADTVEQELDEKELRASINRFVGSLNKKQQRAFLKRYWYLCPSSQIAEECGMTVSAVNVMLHRLRARLKEHLESEGFEL